MITLDFAKDKKYAVLGLNKTGLATVKALTASGAAVIAWDDKEETRAKTNIAGLTLADLGSVPTDGIAALVVSPGISTIAPAIDPVVQRFMAAKIPVISDIELLLQAQPQAKIIGITGTNGKSTTTTLVSHILSESGQTNAIGGNLGNGVMTLPPLGAEGVYVLELSSDQLAITPSLVCDVAVILNMTPEYLDNESEMDGYLAANKNILRRGSKAQRFIISADDAYTTELAALEVLLTTPISIRRHLDMGICIEGGALLENGKEVARIDDLSTLRGLHNGQNIAAAFATARALGLEADAIMTAIRSFPGLAHRQEIVAILDDVQFINDSKATNIDATSQALASFDNIYWIAGGNTKSSGFDRLTEQLSRVRHAYLFGEAASQLSAWLDQHKVAYTVTDTLQRSIQAAAHMAWEDDLEGATVLLSPACKPYDQFPNIEARGELFRNGVQALKVEAAG